MHRKAVPVVDISQYLSGTDKERVVAEIQRACDEVGCFQIEGHGIPLNLVNEVDQAAREFFELSLEEKTRYSVKDSGMGFLNLNKEVLGNHLSSPIQEIKETLNLGLNFERDPWPEHPQYLRDRCLAYIEHMRNLSTVLMRIFASAVGAEENFFDKYVDKPEIILRLAYYPAEESPNAMGANEHTDYGTLTVIWSKSISGLQAKDRASGIWLDIENRPDTFFVNIGDMLQFWTNDRWEATPHRVLSPRQDGQDRLSVVFFHNPNPDAEVRCIDTCCSQDNPAKYEPLLAREYRQKKSIRSRPS